MSKEPIELEFEISVSGRGDGTLDAMYIRLKEAKVARTVEVKPDLLMCDYDAEGQLVGIEILAPVKLSELTELVQHPMRRPFSRFLERSAPRDLVCV